MQTVVAPRSAHLIVAVVVLGAAAPAAAQDSPSEVAAAFLNAIAEERWLDAARHLDVAALDRYRREQIAAARIPQRPPPVVTAEELLRHDPDMPRAVAEYQARKANERMRDPPTWFDHEFAVGSLDSLAALSPEEAAARWLQARDLRWRTRRAVEQMRARGCRLPPEADEPAPAPSERVVAAAIVDSTTAYVLFQHGRAGRANPDVDAALHEDGPHVLTLRRRGGRWRILPRHEMAHGAVFIDYVVDCPREARAPR